MSNEVPSKSLIIGAQLKKARDLLQFTLEDIKQELRIYPEDLLSWEQEQSQPSLAQLESLAKFYGRDIDYFLRETPEPPSNIKYRGKNGASLKSLSNETKLVLAKFDELCRLLLEFEKLLNRKRIIKISPVNKSTNPEYAAKSIRERHNLGDKPISNLRNMLEEDGLVVFELSIPSDEISGSSFWHQEYGPYVLLNARDSKGRRNFTLAHELAHLIYQEGSSSCYIPFMVRTTSEKIENRANRFATDLLLPQSGLLKDFENKKLSETPKENELVQMANKWCVSIQALGYRLENLNLIMQGHTEKLIESEQKYYRRPKTPMWERQLGRRFIDTSIEAYKKNLISISKLAHALQVPIRKAIEKIEEQG